jgi:hypothetical protein
MEVKRPHSHENLPKYDETMVIGHQDSTCSFGHREGGLSEGTALKAMFFYFIFFVSVANFTI